MRLYNLVDLTRLCNSFHRRVDLGYTPQKDGSKQWYITVYTSPTDTFRVTGESIEECIQHIFNHGYLDDVPEEIARLNEKSQSQT